VSNLQIRILATLIYFPALLLSAYDSVAFSLVMSACLAIAWHEYLRFFSTPSSTSDWVVHALRIAIGTLPVILVNDGASMLRRLAVVFLVFQFLAIKSLTRRGTLKALREELSENTLGFLYLTGLFSLLVYCQVTSGAHPIWFLLIIVGASDSGAYFAGRAFGKSPFFQNISPKKTLEGFMGGIGAALIVSAIYWYILSYYEHPIPGFWGCLLLGGFISVISSFGDLFESMLKRHYGVKDSGNIIPGHGGILDRFDAVMFGAVPLFFYVVLRGGFR
jgi:phosphatidate cytidylyltransferase